MSDANLRQLPEFQARLRVLQHYGYVTGDRTVELKGRVMCEIQVTFLWNARPPVSGRRSSSVVSFEAQAACRWL